MRARAQIARHKFDASACTSQRLFALRTTRIEACAEPQEAWNGHQRVTPDHVDKVHHEAIRLIRVQAKASAQNLLEQHGASRRPRHDDSWYGCM